MGKPGFYAGDVQPALRLPNIPGRFSLAPGPDGLRYSSPFEGSQGTPVKRFSFAAAAGDWFKDAARIWTYPFHIEKNDLVPLGFLAITGAILIPNDEKFYGLTDDIAIDHDGDDRISGVVSFMGSTGAWGTAGVFLAVGALTGDDRAVTTAGLAASAMLQSGLVVQVGKMLTGRRRPGDGNGRDLWTGPPGYFRNAEPGQTVRYNAFPSGHTATAFSLATVVAMQYSEHAWVPIASYTMAAAVGVSRLSGNRHWLSDVVFGGVVGHLVARTVVKNYRKRHGIRPALAVGPNSATLTVSF